MSGELTALGALVAGSDWRAAEAAERLAIERGIRASLLCVLLGLEREAATWPYPAQAAAGRASKAGKMLADLFEPMDAIGQLATLAGAADLDPMDPGPSHTVLPAPEPGSHLADAGWATIAVMTTADAATDSRNTRLNRTWFISSASPVVCGRLCPRPCLRIDKALRGLAVPNF